MPRAVGVALTGALELMALVTQTGGHRWIIQMQNSLGRVTLDIQERYSPDERGERVMGVSGSTSDEGELPNNEDIDDDGGEYMRSMKLVRRFPWDVSFGPARIPMSRWEAWRDNQVLHEVQGKIRWCFLQSSDL